MKPIPSNKSHFKTGKQHQSQERKQGSNQKLMLHHLLCFFFKGSLLAGSFSAFWVFLNLNHSNNTTANIKTGYEAIIPWVQVTWAPIITNAAARGNNMMSRLLIHSTYYRTL